MLTQKAVINKWHFKNKLAFGYIISVQICYLNFYLMQSESEKTLLFKMMRVTPMPNGVVELIYHFYQAAIAIKISNLLI